MNSINAGDGTNEIVVSGTIKNNIVSGSGNDNITIKSGASVSGVIDGGSGDDTYTFYTGSGSKTISDTSGTETLVFTDTKFSDLDFDYYYNSNTLKIINNNLLDNMKIPDTVNINNFLDSGFDKIIALDEDGIEKEYSILKDTNTNINSTFSISDNQIDELNQYITSWTADSFDSSTNIVDMYTNNSTDLETLVPVQ